MLFLILLVVWGKIISMKHRVKNIHFVGIGGFGMSGIAEIMLNLGYCVSGSDLGWNLATQRLTKLGARISYRHLAENVDTADIIVVSNALKSDNPEIVAAYKKQIPVISRAVMLAELMRLKKGIAVSGTHGKTTTTSFIASVLTQAGLDPTFIIGGCLISVGANAKLGSGSFIVVEADESDASFLNLTPVIEVITNIDADHMDTYGHNFSKLQQVFIEFTQRLPFYGFVVLCLDDTPIREIIPMISKPIITYGFHQDSDVRAINIEVIDGKMGFTVIQKYYMPMQIRLNQPGMHNVQNACAAIAIARELDIIDAHIQTALSEFHGISRRFTRYEDILLKNNLNCKKSLSSFTLVDDYGHHPAEIAATLSAARAFYPGRRLVLAFQPHRYTRTRDLFEEFVKVLSTSDVLILAEVYGAGEYPITTANGNALAHAVRIAGQVKLFFVKDIAEMLKMIVTVLRDDDVMMTMGAGSISNVPAQLISVIGLNT